MRLTAMGPIDLRLLLLFSAVHRLVLIIYGEWQDTHMEVRYTDVDYFVFSDAASLMALGKSPYERSTIDIHLCSHFCFYRILWFIGHGGSFCYLLLGRCYKRQAAFWYGLVVYFRIYPIIYALPIVLVLYPRKHASGAKPSLQNWILNQYKFDQSSSGKRPFHAYTPWIFLKSLLTRERILFGFFSASWFFFWTELSFYFYGWEFLHEALLYHLTRTDPRHNFSIYFYHIYLHHEHEFSVMKKLASFLPQLLVQLVLIFRFAFDLPFYLFLQTVAFVAFNKVITAQYFVWFFCLLPLILPWSNMNLRWEGLCCIFMWIAAQGHWLMWGYLLEFKGKNVFLQLWFAGLLFLAVNTWVLIMIIRHHTFSQVFVQPENSNVKGTKKLK